MSEKIMKLKCRFLRLGIFLGHFGKLTSCDFSDILDLFTGILVLDKSRIFTKFSNVLPLTMFKG